MIRKSFINLFFALIFSIVWGQEKQYAVHTVAFYNVENLFDTIKSPNTFDAEFTPNGQRGWGTQKYNRKLNLLAEAISQIGTDENPNMPTILGVSEIENRAVLEDLIKEERLQSANYGIIHFDSPDRRGIDVALLYQLAQKAFLCTSMSNPNQKEVADTKKVSEFTHATSFW